jgi:hypothetical protein
VVYDKKRGTVSFSHNQAISVQSCVSISHLAPLQAWCSDATFPFSNHDSNVDRAQKHKQRAAPLLKVACNVAASPMLDENCPVWTEGCLTAQPLNPPFTYCPSSPPHILAGEAIAHTARQRPCSCIALMVPSYAQNRFLAHLSSNSRRHQSTKLMRDACNTSGGQSSIQSQSSRSGGRSPPHTTDGHDEW